MSADSLTDILASRQSCRGFLPDPVQREKIEAVIRDACRVPSWCNSQPWQVIGCSGTETDCLRHALYLHAGEARLNSDIPFPDAYEGVYKSRRSTCGWQLYGAIGVQKGDRAASELQMMENFRLFGAPNFLLITTPKALGSYGVLDCGAFVTGVLLGLEARGLGGIAMASIAGFSGFMRDWFSVPEDRDVLCGVACGAADPNHPANGFRTNRAPLDEVFIWR